MDHVQRFDIPTKGRSDILSLFTAFRQYAMKIAHEKGEQLDPQWYPEEHPELWADRPEMLERLGLSTKSPKAVE